MNDLISDVIGTSHINFLVIPQQGKVAYVIYYASQVSNGVQVNYFTTEKELLAVVFALEKFKSYLLGAKVIMYSNHTVL